MKIIFVFMKFVAMHIILLLCYQAVLNHSSTRIEKVARGRFVIEHGARLYQTRRWNVKTAQVRDITASRRHQSRSLIAVQHGYGRRLAARGYAVLTGTSQRFLAVLKVNKSRNFLVEVEPSSGITNLEQGFRVPYDVE